MGLRGSVSCPELRTQDDDTSLGGGSAPEPPTSSLWPKGPELLTYAGPQWGPYTGRQSHEIAREGA